MRLIPNREERLFIATVCMSMIAIVAVIGIIVLLVILYRKIKHFRKKQLSSEGCRTEPSPQSEQEETSRISELENKNNELTRMLNGYKGETIKLVDENTKLKNRKFYLKEVLDQNQINYHDSDFDSDSDDPKEATS